MEDMRCLEKEQPAKQKPNHRQIFYKAEIPKTVSGRKPPV